VDYFLLIVFLLIALVFSFMCSVFEAVLLSIRRPYIEAQKEAHAENASTWERLLSNINKPLSAILILNTVAHTVGAAGVGGQAMRIFGSAPLTTGLISAVLTLLILVLSEIIPKTLGAVYWKQLAPLTGKLGISKGEKKSAYDRAEFVAMADIGEKEGTLAEDEGRIVKNLFALRDTIAKHAATPRPVVFALPKDCTVGDFARLHSQQPFSRIPLFEDNVDDTSSFALKVEILQAHSQGHTDKTLKDFSRPLQTVPETQILSQLFRRMVAERFHIAATIDEFGSFSGLISMEDVIETLIGDEIVDEVDKSEDMQQKARELWKKRAAHMGLSYDDFSSTDAPS